MRIHTFQELVTRINNLSTRDGKPIRTEFGGPDAWTRKGLIRLPALPAGSTLTPSQFAIFLGYTLHEGPGHQQFTDLDLYASEVKKTSDQTFSTLLNWLEDIRIENLDIARYPGDRKYLDQTHQFVDNQTPKEITDNPDLMSLTYKECYVKYRNLDTRILKGQLQDQGPSGQKISQLLTQLPNCKSTQDCINLAHEIHQIIKEAESEPRDSNRNRPDNTSDLPNATVNPDNKTNQERDQEGQPRQSLTEQFDENNSSPNGNTNNPGNHQRDHNSNSEAQIFQSWLDSTEIKNLVTPLVQQILDNNSQSNNKIPIPVSASHRHSGERILPPDSSHDQILIPSIENLPQFLSDRAQATAQILALKKMFRLYLQTRSRKSWLRGLEEGESLDPQRLHVLATGQTSVFKQKHERQLVDTAIELMIDLSGSMRQSNIRLASIILAESLSAIPEIKLSICGFNAGSGSSRHLPGIGRTSPMTIFLFKNFAEPYHKCRARLGGMRPENLTPLGDAYGKALEYILPRPEPRKIIFLVTDGKPKFNRSDYSHSDYRLMSQIHRNAQKFHIETLGLGIGPEVEFLNDYVDQYIHSKSLQTLPQELMQALKGLLK